MKKSVWRTICIISIVLSILLALFHVGIFVLAQVGGVLLLLLTLNPETTQLHPITWSEFFANFVGSPLFYIDLAVGAVLAVSMAMWILCKIKEKRKIKEH